MDIEPENLLDKLGNSDQPSSHPKGQTKNRVNRYKPRRRRRWFLQFLGSGIILITLGIGLKHLLDKAWGQIRQYAFNLLPEPVVEELKKVEEQVEKAIARPDLDLPKPVKSTYTQHTEKLKNEDAYNSFLAGLELKHIQPEDVIKPHRNICNGVHNELPPRIYWTQIKSTLKAADALAEELNAPLKAINSAYRSPAYNAECSGSAKNSYHTKNMALDLVFDCPPTQVAKTAKKLRSKGIFKGGIGVYSSFVHIDTRGRKADWGIQV